MQENLNTIFIEDNFINHENRISELTNANLKLINNEHSNNFQNSNLISLLDDVFEAIAEINETGIIIRVNKTFTKIFGYSEENIIGTNKDNMLYEEDKKLFANAVDRMILNGKAKTELRLLRHNGSICFGKIVLIKNADTLGNYNGYYSFMEDITEHVIAEKSLKDAQNFLISTLNSLSENVAIIDENGIILAVNRAWTAFALQNGGDLKKTGIGSNYLQTCEISIGKKSDEGKIVANGIKKVLNGELNVFELKYQCDSLLEERWFIIKVTKFLGEGTKKAVILHADISNYEKAERALSKSEEKYRTLIQNASDIVTVIDSKGIVKFASPSTERVLGYNADYRKGRSVFELIHPDDIEKVKETLIQNIGKPNNIVTVEYWIKNAGGDYICMESVANNLLLDPNVQGIVINSRDITDRKYAEEQTKASLNEKEILLKEIHHRVKNNLQIVTSLLKLQESHINDDNFRKIFNESIGRVKAMALIHQGLFQENSLSQIDFGRYLRSLIEFLKEAYDTDERNIECEIITDKTVFNIETAVPCGLIVNELVSNALKHAFTESSGGKLIVTIETKNKHILTISDNGKGIPANVMFNKAKTLGLSLVNTLSQQLDAEIEIDNSNGTTFRLKFDDLIYKERVL